MIFDSSFIECRLFSGVVSGEEIFSLLQHINDGFCTREEAREIGTSLVSCSLLRPVTGGYRYDDRSTGGPGPVDLYGNSNGGTGNNNNNNNNSNGNADNNGNGDRTTAIDMEGVDTGAGGAVVRVGEEQTHRDRYVRF